MSPNISMMALALVGVLSWPMVTPCAQQSAGAAARTSDSSLPAATERSETPADPTEIAEVDVLKKNFATDLSRLPLPLSHGPLVVGAFHVFPAQEPGPYLGPPTRIWGLGFGTSLWRNYVTGWPEM